MKLQGFGGVQVMSDLHGARRFPLTNDFIVDYFSPTEYGTSPHFLWPLLAPYICALECRLWIVICVESASRCRQTYSRATMAQSYKSLKENFVSNLSGGSIWEINYITAVAPVCLARITESTMLIKVMLGCHTFVVGPPIKSGLLRGIRPHSFSS